MALDLDHLIRRDYHLVEDLDLDILLVKLLSQHLEPAPLPRVEVAPFPVQLPFKLVHLPGHLVDLTVLDVEFVHQQGILLLHLL